MLDQKNVSEISPETREVMIQSTVQELKQLRERVISEEVYSGGI